MDTSPPKPAREPISKKLRFEVFKRDSFRCQYCGKSAPEVILEVDHLKPVAEGGKSDILNLITSCKPCNAGKGKRPLSDTSTLTKQMDQLKELNERREQLEMLIEWKNGLLNLREESVSRIAEYWSQHFPGHPLNEQGRRTLKKMMTKFDYQEILDAIPTAAEQYSKYDNKGNLERSSVDLAWSKVAGICRTRRLKKKKPYIKDLFYIRGILRMGRNIEINPFRLSQCWSPT